MLERYAMKVARTVLRGGRGSNVTPLPDQEVSSKKIKRGSRNKKRSGSCMIRAVFCWLFLR